MVLFFWECPHLLFVSLRDHPEFDFLLNCERSSWPRCLAWHDWLPSVSRERVHPPWAAVEVDVVDAALEKALGPYPLELARAWCPEWDPADIIDLADDMPANPNIWTDGSRDEDLDAMVGVAGSGAYVKSVSWVFDDRAWGHAQDLDLDDDAPRIFPWFLGLCRRSSEASIGVLSGLCRLLCQFIWVLTTKTSAQLHFCFGPVLGPVGHLWLTRFGVMPLMPWLLRARCAGGTRRVMMLLI